MNYRFISKNYFRYLHSKNGLPELDFTKPKSDRLKKFSLKNSRNFNDKNILKISLRGQCLFGLYPIELALQAKRRIFYQLFFSNTSNNNRQIIENIQNLAKQLLIPIQYVQTNILDCLAFDRPHQGVCLDCSSLPLKDIQEMNFKMKSNQISLDLCLVKIHDPMNLGAIIRTAYFFGIENILLTHGTCQPSPVASKASSGALELISIYTCNHLKDYLKYLLEQKTIAIICATHHGNISLKTFNLNDIKKNFPNLEKILLLIGNEQEGISDDIIQMCHYHVSIQSNRNSQISSLNASVASALFLYHISAQMNK